MKTLHSTPPQKKEKEKKRNNSATMSQGPGSPARDTHSSIFELFCRCWTYMYAAHKHIDPRLVGTRRLKMLTHTYLITNQSEECSWVDHALLLDPLLRPLGQDIQFWGHSPLCPPLPGKAIKLFFSTSPKTLSPKFNLVPVYRGQIFCYNSSSRPTRERPRNKYTPQNNHIGCS